jgi:hypothetical protein
MKFRVAGLTLGNEAVQAGIQFEPKDDDREIARRVVNDLSDRRMLWRDFTMEVEEHCVESAIQLRRQLGERLNTRGISPELAKRIQLIQRLLPSFIDEMETDERLHHRTHWGTDLLSVALGRLRALIGVQLGDHAASFRLDVPEDLATIVPDEQGWFFERFE